MTTKAGVGTLCLAYIVQFAVRVFLAQRCPLCEPDVHIRHMPIVLWVVPLARQVLSIMIVCNRPTTILTIESEVKY